MKEYSFAEIDNIINGNTWIKITSFQRVSKSCEPIPRWTSWTPSGCYDITLNLDIKSGSKDLKNNLGITFCKI